MLGGDGATAQACGHTGIAAAAVVVLSRLGAAATTSVVPDDGCLRRPGCPDRQGERQETDREREGLDEDLVV